MDAVASHSCHLLQQLRDQRIQGLLCDCMLVVKGVCFKAHKNVLAAFSQYFRTLFQNSAGQKNDVFHLDIKNVGGIGQILDYMYTSHLDLNRDNVQTLLDIAQCLQVQNVLNICRSFLKTSTAVEQPASIPCNDAFSLQNMTADTNCDSYSTNLLHVCSSPVESCKVLDDHHLHGPQPVALHISSGDVSKQKQDSMDASCTDCSFKQPNYHYKLRNFYSKQFYKQTTCPSNKSSSEPSFDFSASAEQNTVKNDSCTINQSECVLESSSHLSPSFLVQPLNERSEEQDLEGTSLQPAREMRLKKAMHLKKLNFLRSQKSPEQSSVLKIPNGDIARETELERESSTKSANTDAIERKAVKHVVSSECLEQSVELEPSQEPSEPGSQLQMFLSERQYPCALCGKAFKHPSNLELHIRSHTGEKPFECNICGKCFSQAGNLQTHLRRHSGEKPYICEICGKRFAASGDVQRHIIIHTGEKPHLCDICGRGFSNFSNLKEHKKNHTVEKVFTCDECGKSFNLPRKLVKHRIRHTGERPYSCSACGKCFAGSGDLRRHIRTHTGEKPYNCETCNKCFSRSAVLRRHKKIHCKAGNEGPNMLDEFTQAVEISDLEKSQSSDSFTQEISVTLLPVSVKFPIHPNGNSSNEVDSSGATFCKMQSTVQQNDCINHQKLSLDPTTLHKSQERPSRPCCSKEMDLPPEEEPLQSDGVPMIRSSMSTLGSSCTELSSRVPSTEYRNSEGPFFSSVTLWGLAMKTLQNENELGQ
ncbi:zinc finger and BTB domain-containing protein 49 isoform X1 [Varanus komodoensis]|uniref:Zinc finger and BTB domain-containing protein 49 n=1 Tax=Varanus komodoensis TaxID=61221 RepID=A0A8D2L123_VARKO|nr:zinc finger and BTB domain-containing protein 49 isoform X1 [Varanus komodoensis]XP_044273931.1 zinc finger and BTB domain-containing protein 49 isoform X1 [Varanus komodoensis]XP_044273932.1 zinc finger and BTB domain-containing protein 49 isoform X1 [Varanus komodoensis]XP_044273933.1 zinc finger and BTB domain-containing protein 49 isoform X1 [Varanus komodoensis]